MKVKAKTNVKYNADWFFTGMTFDVNEADLPSFGSLVEVVETPATQPEPVQEEKPAVAEKAPEIKEEQGKPKTPAARRKKTNA